MPIRKTLLQAVRRYHLITPGDRVLLGVSGGQDSLALLLALHDLSRELQISLVAGHLHHGLRGAEGDADQEFVADLARQLAVPFVAEAADVAALAQTEHIGLEEAGRHARYAFFQRAAAEAECNKVAVAHTATDRAETLLMNLFRGAGLYGVRSIPPKRGQIIRPLILATRQETGEYCRIKGLQPRTDACNLDQRYLRNRIRTELLPHLENEYGRGIEKALAGAADALFDEIEWTEPLVAQALITAGGPGELQVQALAELPPGLRYRVLRHFLQAHEIEIVDLSRERWRALEALIYRGQTGKRLELCPEVYVQLEYGFLRVCRASEVCWEPEEVFTLPLPGSVQVSGVGVVEATVETLPPAALSMATAMWAVLDADRVGETLLLRRPRPGDRFVPLGMTGTKKLQDFFVDGKVPPRERNPLLVTRADGEIVWVVGHRLADLAKVDDKTTRYLVVRVRV